MRFRQRAIAGSVIGVLAVITSMLWASPVAAAPDPSKIEKYYTVSAGVELKFDGTSETVVPNTAKGTYQEIDASGNVLRQEAVATSVQLHEAGTSGVGDFTCVISNHDDPRLLIAPPLDITLQGNSYFLQYLLHSYWVRNARNLIGVGPTTQNTRCKTGGGHVWNDYHQTFNGVATIEGHKDRHIIGHNWPSHAVNGNLTSQMSFQVAQPPLTVGGSVSVQEQDNYGGNTGPNEFMDTQFQGWDPAWNVNRVNSYYVAPTNFRWDGSSSYQGTTHQVLYEWPVFGQTGRLTHNATMRAHCSLPAWSSCPAFN